MSSRYYKVTSQNPSEVISSLIYEVHSPMCFGGLLLFPGLLMQYLLQIFTYLSKENTQPLLFVFCLVHEALQLMAVKYIHPAARKMGRGRLVAIDFLSPPVGLSPLRCPKRRPPPPDLVIPCWPGFLFGACSTSMCLAPIMWGASFCTYANATTYMAHVVEACGCPHTRESRLAGFLLSNLSVSVVEGLLLLCAGPRELLASLCLPSLCLRWRSSQLVHRMQMRKTPPKWSKNYNVNNLICGEVNLSGKNLHLTHKCQ